jgi:hypothetical protein
MKFKRKFNIFLNLKSFNTFKKFKRDIKAFIHFFLVALLIFILIVGYYNKNRVHALVQINKLKSEVKSYGVSDKLIPILNSLSKDVNMIVDVILFDKDTLVFSSKNSWFANNMDFLSDVNNQHDIKSEVNFGFTPIKIGSSSKNIDKENISGKSSQDTSNLNKEGLSQNNTQKNDSKRYLLKEIRDKANTNKIIFIIQDNPRTSQLFLWIIAGFFCFSALFIAIFMIIFIEFLRDLDKEAKCKGNLYNDELFTITD